MSSRSAADPLNCIDVLLSSCHARITCRRPLVHATDVDGARVAQGPDGEPLLLGGRALVVAVASDGSTSVLSSDGTAVLGEHSAADRVREVWRQKMRPSAHRGACCDSP